MPLFAEERIWVDAGALMSYATNAIDTYRLLATYVDKIRTKGGPLLQNLPEGEYSFVLALPVVSGLLFETGNQGYARAEAKSFGQDSDILKKGQDELKT